MRCFSHCGAQPSLGHAQISGGFPDVFLVEASSRHHTPWNFSLKVTRSPSQHLCSSQSFKFSRKRNVFVSDCQVSTLKTTSLCAQQGTSRQNPVENGATQSDERAQCMVEIPKKGNYQITSLVVSSTSPMKFLSTFQLPSVEQLFFLVGLLSCVALGAFLAVLATAIPTLRSMRKAAISMEKLANIAIQELPSTMAAMRLSSMEISDLTLELHDLSQEISDGVKSSARAVKAAEVGIRQMGAVAASQTLAILQEGANVPVAVVKPVVASAAASTRQAVAQAQKAVANIASNPYTLRWLKKITQKGQSEANIVGVLDVKPNQNAESADEDKTDKLPADLN